MNSTPSTPQPNHSDPDELIRAHLPLAYRLAACYRGSGQSYEDLVQIAQVGLVRAAESFDPASGAAFRAFATPIISAELGRCLRERSQTGQMAGSQRRISAALSRGPRVRELARLLAVDSDVMAEALVHAAGREAVTLNLPARRRRGGASPRLHCISARPAAA